MDEILIHNILLCTLENSRLVLEIIDEYQKRDNTCLKGFLTESEFKAYVEAAETNAVYYDILEAFDAEGKVQDVLESLIDPKYELPNSKRFLYEMKHQIQSARKSIDILAMNVCEDSKIKSSPGKINICNV